MVVKLNHSGLILLIPLIALVGCYKENHKTFAPKVSLSNNALASILTLSNSSGIVYSAVTITGAMFDTARAANIVKFNGKTAIINSISTSKIVATVPFGATTGKVTITTGSNILSSVYDFKVLQLIKDGSTTLNFIPNSLAFDQSGNGTVYASDYMNLYKMSANTPGVKIFGLPPNPYQTYPNHRIESFTTTKDGNLYASISTTGFATVEESVQEFIYDCLIKRITPDGQTKVVLGKEVKLAGQPYIDGDFNTATFNYAGNMLTDNQGINLYIYDSGAIRKITEKGVVSTIVKPGFFLNGLLMAVYNNNDIATIGCCELRKVNPDNGKISVVAGQIPGGAGLFKEQTDGQGTAATFAYYQSQIATDAANNLFISEERHDGKPGTVIRIVNTANYVSTFDSGLPSNTKVFIDKITGKIYLVSGKIITRFSFK